MKRLSLLLMIVCGIALVSMNLHASEVTIGTGNQAAKKPLNMHSMNSLYECVYYQDELQIINGTITGVAFYNDFITDLPNMPVKIWLGTTTQTDLSAGWVPSTQLIQVFSGSVNFPSGINTINIPFTTSLLYNGGALVMMVERPMDTNSYADADQFLCQTIGTTRALDAFGNITDFDPSAPPINATLSGQFPKTTFFYTGQSTANDLACLSVTGNTTPGLGSSTDYVISIDNNGTASQSSYQVKLMKEGGIVLGSVAGTVIAPNESQTFTIPWIPNAIGPTYIYGKVVLPGDEIPSNNESQHLNIVVRPQIFEEVTVGAGGSTGRIPMDFYWKNSLFETIYLSSELNTGGLLSEIQFYNNFSTTIPAKPTKIWVGETTQTDLSAGWIPSSQLSLVFNGTVDYPSGANLIPIHLTTLYAYSGGNLVVMIERPMDTSFYSATDLFVTQSGTIPARTRFVYGDAPDFDPSAPPAVTPEAIFPKTTFKFIVNGLGSLSGTVYAGTTPLPGATVTIDDTNLNFTTTANGTYSFPFLGEGLHQVSATIHGYNVVTHPVSIVEDQAATQDFTLLPLGQVSVSGHIVGSNQPTEGISNATIRLNGFEAYTATTSATGNFMIPNVYINQTYTYEVMVTGYHRGTGQVVVDNTNLNMGLVILNEIAFPPLQVVATESADFSNVAVTWSEPGPIGPTWLHYDSGANYNSIGTGGIADFDVAIRFPANALMGYAGYCLQAVKVWLAEPGIFSVRVWTGGTATTPGTMVIDQLFTPTLNTYNTVLLDSPIFISGSEEIWIGYHLNVISGYPAGCDAGPALEGFGNMMNLGGPWTTLSNNAPGLNYNWNIQGYVGFGTPSKISKLQPLAFKENTHILGTLAAKDMGKTINTAAVNKPIELRNDRALEGYNIYRLLAADADNEALWTLLTPTSITPLNFTDNAWVNLPPGVYNYAVKAVYTNDVLSIGFISNNIHKGVMGLLTGTVSNFVTNEPIEGAVVNAGAYTGTSNVDGVYSFPVYTGTYTVTASKFGFHPYSQPNVVIVGQQTTTQNIQMIAQSGNIAGTIYNTSNTVIIGATVSCGNVTTTTNANGAYNMQVRVGTVTVTASHPNYSSVTQSGVLVVNGQTTTVDFHLVASETLLEEGFETYDNFALLFAPWTCVDVDLSGTYNISGVTFPNSASPMAYIIFVPSATTPNLTAIAPHGGIKMAACFAATIPPNNDWLITPALINPTQISFWARSHVSTYGLERFNVGVSTTGTDPEDFTIISGASYIQAPLDWTQYTYSLAGYTGNVYVGIQCVSDDAFTLFVDDVTSSGKVANDDPNAPISITELHNNYPNPFNPETTISYSVKAADKVSLQIYNVKGQLVKTLVNEVKNIGKYSIVWNSIGDSGQKVTSGVYFCRMTSGSYSSSRKMILMK
jgi:hypothetical protein